MAKNMGTIKRIWFIRLLTSSLLSILVFSFIFFFYWHLTSIENILFFGIVIIFILIDILIFIPKFEDRADGIFQIGIFGVIGYLMIIGGYSSGLDFTNLLLFLLGFGFILMSITLIFNNFIKRDHNKDKSPKP